MILPVLSHSDLRSPGSHHWIRARVMLEGISQRKAMVFSDQLDGGNLHKWGYPFMMETSIKLDDLGVPPIVGNPHIYRYIYFLYVFRTQARLLLIWTSVKRRPLSAEKGNILMEKQSQTTWFTGDMFLVFLVLLEIFFWIHRAGSLTTNRINMKNSPFAGFQSHGGTQIGWCLMENPTKIWMIWGYPYDSGNLHLGIVT